MHGIEATESGTTITGDGIEFFRLLTIKRGLRIMGIGLKFKGRSPLAVLKQDYKLPVRTVAQGLEAVEKLISEWKAAHPIPETTSP